MNDSLCTGCTACVEVCPEGAITMKDGIAVTNRDLCTGCGECSGVCFFDARKLSGRLYTPDEITEEVLKDEVVYRNTGGGVTFSGGEPLLYPDFVCRVFSDIRAKGFGTAVETCGQVDWTAFEKTLPVTDLLLFDIKLADGEKHREWTGADNGRILENASKAAKIVDRLIPRIPLIPGVNDDASEFSAILDICESLEGADEIHLLPFHQLGSLKYEMLDYRYQLKEKGEENSSQVEFCRVLAEKRGFSVNIGGAGLRAPDKVKSTGGSDGWFLYKK